MLGTYKINVALAGICPGKPLEHGQPLLFLLSLIGSSEGRQISINVNEPNMGDARKRRVLVCVWDYVESRRTTLG